MGIEESKNGARSLIFRCLFLIKFMLPTEVTNRFSDSDIMGIAKVLMPMIANSAV
jgi:hypothetical protein